MLNFDNLPKDRPTQFQLVPAGYAYFEVKSAEVKKSTGAKTAGTDCLEAVLECTNPATGIKGRIWDTFYDSDASLVRYKLRKFLESIGCILQGEFNFKDLTKIIVGKKGIVAVKINENPGYKPRNEVDAYDDDIYYPLSAAETLMPAEAGNPPTTPDDEPPFEFTAADSADPAPTTTAPEEEGEY